MRQTLELDASLDIAQYRVSGDARHLMNARKIAFEARMASIGTSDVPACIKVEPSLLRRWFAGRTYAYAVLLEGATWGLPCECDPGTNYRCGNHFEVSETRCFYPAAYGQATAVT